MQSLLVLAAIGSICRDFGPLSDALTSSVTIILLVLYQCSTLAEKQERYTSLPLGLIFIFCIALNSHAVLQLGMLCAYLFILQIYSRNRGNDASHHGLSLSTTALYTLVYFCYRYFPEGWYAADYCAGLFSTLCSYVFTRELHFGPTGCGLFIVCAFFLYHTARLLLGSKSRQSILRYVCALGYMGLAWLVWVELLLVTEYTLKNASVHVYRNQLHVQAVLFVLLAGSHFITGKIPVHATKAFPGKIRAVAAAVCLLITACCAVGHVVYGTGSNKNAVKTVLFYKQGALDWDTARFGKYGQRSGGMFGLMPKYLKAAGSSTRMIDSLKPSVLAGGDVLVMINLNKALTKKELFTVWQFVRHGGGLLLLGDHTDLAGHMKNFNKILMHVPLKLKFDSAMPSRYTWDNLMEIRPHVLSSGFGYEARRSWWVGASLACEYPTVPLVIGKYCYSDKGYKDNPKKAFLGNRRFDSYERLNDNVLAAVVPYGKGKIMVCGDTSAYHNTVFMTTHRFVRHTMEVLGHRTMDDSPVVKRVFKTGLFAGILLLICFGFIVKPDALIAAIVVVVLAASVWCAEAVQKNRYRYDIPYDVLKVALLDFSHGGRFDLMSWEDDSIGGLRNNLFRNGYWPFLFKRFNRDELLKARV